MSATSAVASFFRQITECMRSGHFSLNYWTGKWKRINVSAKRPPLIYFIFNVRWQTGRTIGSPFDFFLHCATFFEFFCLQRVPPSILLKFSLVTSGVKRYIRTILRLSKEEAEVRKQEFSRKPPPHILKTALSEPYI